MLLSFRRSLRSEGKMGTRRKDQFELDLKHGLAQKSDKVVCSKGRESSAATRIVSLKEHRLDLHRKEVMESLRSSGLLRKG